MPRQLTFKIKKKEYTAEPVKVDRKKLYGWVEILALDDKGEPCTLISTDESGSVLIPKGGTGLGILSEKSEWIERSELVAVKEDGKPADLITSSYNTVVELKDKVTAEEFLDYSITDFYELMNVDNELVKAIGKDIYTFTYSYLDNYEGSPAFLMVSDNTLYMLIGIANNFEMLCFGDCGSVDDTEDDTFQIEDDDNLDFSMLNYK